MRAILYYSGVVASIAIAQYILKPVALNYFAIFSNSLYNSLLFISITLIAYVLLFGFFERRIVPVPTGKK